jgi:hypothetical protein
MIASAFLTTEQWWHGFAGRNGVLFDCTKVNLKGPGESLAEFVVKE